MPLVYDKALKQFIFYPTDVASTDHDVERQKVITSRNRNRSFYRSPLIPNTPQADSKVKHLLFIRKINKPHFLLIASGWIGILLYFFYHPLSFHVISFISYLGLAGLSLIITIIIDSAFGYKFSCKEKDILSADLKARGMFFRELRRVLQRRFPKLGFLSHEKYDYKKIHLAADPKKINVHSKKERSKSITYLLTSNLEGRYRWKYRDPKIQDFLEKYQVLGRKKSSKEIWLGLIMFLLSIPSEDGLFLVPLYFIEINVLTSIVFSLLFGFAHFGRYSIFNCLRITFCTFFVILFILPSCGLLTLIMGHIVWDLIFSIPDFASIVRETKQARQ